MNFLTEISRRSRKIIIPVLGAAAVSYFGYHAVQGERGVVEWWKLQQEIARAADQRDQIAGQRASLDYRVKLLGADNLDLDMLEERARVVLNMSRPNEMVIFDEAL